MKFIQLFSLFGFSAYLWIERNLIQFYNFQKNHFLCMLQHIWATLSSILQHIQRNSVVFDLQKEKKKYAKNSKQNTILIEVIII